MFFYYEKTYVMTYNYVAGRFIIRWNHDFFPGFGGGGGGGVYDSRKLLVTTATTCGQGFAIRMVLILYSVYNHIHVYLYVYI